MQQKSKSQKALVLILMVISLCTIYILPYLRYSYFTPLQEAMRLTDDATKFGLLMTVYGIMNVIFYLPGGYIADKFDPKKLLVFSMIASGALGLWLATWPGFTALMIIHALWSVTTVLTFWSASIKCVNMLSKTEDQGQTFGLLEGGRGLVGLGVNAAFLAMFAYFAANPGNAASGNVKGVTWVVIGVSLLMILDGIALAFLMPKTEKSVATNETFGESIRALGKAFTLPITYALAGVIFTCSAIGAIAAYYAPYLQNFAGLTVVATSTFALIRGQVATIAAAPIAGFTSKKVGNSGIVMLFACAVLVIVGILLRLIPASPAVLVTLMILMTVGTFFFACNRAVYWAIIDEAGTRKNMVGGVIGVASLIGYLPDVFIHTVFGNYLDVDATTAFNKMFIWYIAVAAMGLVAAYVATRAIKKHKAQRAADVVSEA